MLKTLRLLSLTVLVSLCIYSFTGDYVYVADTNLDSNVCQVYETSSKSVAVREDADTDTFKLASKQRRVFTNYLHAIERTPVFRTGMYLVAS